MKISTSFLSCSKILPAINMISLTDTNYIHVDFIDGKFVQGKKIPFRKLKKIRKITSKRLDVHLMTDKLSKYIKKFALLNCEYITFHISATDDVVKYINLIHSYGIKCGLAINPDEDLDLIKPYLDLIDLVLVMSVNPGYGGQSFIPKTVDKLKSIKKYLVDNKIDLVLSVDGGINGDTINLVNNYVDMIVSGSFITSSNDFQKQIDLLKAKKK